MTKFSTSLKRISIPFILLIFASVNIFAQKFEISHVNVSKFPTVQAHILAKDNLNQDYGNLLKTEFSVKENNVDISSKVNLLCQENLTPQPISLALMLDASISMNELIGGEKKYDLVQFASKVFADSLKFVPGTAASVIQFSNALYNGQPNDKIVGWQGTRDSLKRVLGYYRGVIAGVTNFNTPFLDQVNGAFEQFKKRPGNIRKVAVLLTDGEHEHQNPFLYDEIIAKAKEQRIEIYVILLNYNVVTNGLNFLPRETGGIFYTPKNKEQLLDVYRLIAEKAQPKYSCLLEWKSDLVCDANDLRKNIEVTFKRPNPALTYSGYYDAPNNGIASASIDANKLLFGTTANGGVKTRSLTISADNGDYTLTNFDISPATNDFVINWNGKSPKDVGGLVLKQGEKRTISITYNGTAAVDYPYNLSFTSAPCAMQSVELIAPCSGIAEGYDFGNTTLANKAITTISKAFTNNTAATLAGVVKLFGTNKDEFTILEVNGNSAGTNFTINQNESVEVKVQLNSKTTGSKSAFLQFEIDANCGLPQAELKAEIIDGSIAISSYDWGAKRVKTNNTHLYTIQNTSLVPVKITKIELNGTNANFSMDDIASLLPIDLAKDDEFTFNVKFHPQTEGNHNQTIKVEIENGSAPIEATLSGIGALPSLLATNLVFQEFDVNTTSPSKNIILENRSSTADLKISEIRFRSGSNLTNDFAFVNPSNLKNLTIAKNKSITVPVTFTPKKAGNITAIVQIIADNVEGPEPITEKVNEITVSGIGIAQISDLTLNDIDFGSNNVSCLEYTKTFEIDNIDNSNEVNVSFIVPNGSDFSISPSNVKVAANEQKNITITYSPSTSGISTSTISFTSERGNGTFEVTGTAQVTAMTLSNLTETTIQPGSKLSVITKLPVLNAYNSSKVSKLQIKLKYNPSMIRIHESADAVTSNVNLVWTVDKINQDKGEIILSANNPMAALSNVELTNTVKFDTYLGEKTTAIINAEYTLLGIENCLLVSPIDIAVDYSGCNVGGRLLDISKLPTNFADIHPNPVDNDRELNFSINFDNTYSTIHLYDSYGNLVKTIQEGTLKAGEHKAILEVQDLTDGIYFCKMNAGIFTSTQKIMILK